MLGIRIGPASGMRRTSTGGRLVNSITVNSNGASIEGEALISSRRPEARLSRVQVAAHDQDGCLRRAKRLLHLADADRVTGIPEAELGELCLAREHRIVREPGR